MATSTFPEPLIVPPFTPPHTQTIILLHGRGSRATNFGPVLLDTPFPFPSTTSPTTTFRKSLPHTKFIFPTAPRSRATIYKRSIINQWFDGWHVDSPQNNKDWLAIDGLQLTTRHLHDLIRAEAELVPGGAGSVVIGGISQGCAAALVAAILWEGDELGGVIGMCGYLPFAGGITAALEKKGEDTEEIDPFERGDEEKSQGEEDLDEEDPGTAAVRELRQFLELEDTSSPQKGFRAPILSTPIFLGHGIDDEKVPLGVGTTMASCLARMGINTSWHTYPHLGHWFSANMLSDIFLFLQTKKTSSLSH
ncbi:alpha/beta-hydrolase [Echria macrotheca]|uniref:Alpha/beta-hydrolase n=1 Tax=Echria macrotheca TaxID=438768 RepID=A0AAJ0BJB3_9PEZI|nr:alpha/beta-hydrolase [Echria macrotheca]